MSLNNPVNVIQTTMRLIQSNENSNIRLNAHGGNSILMVCDPIHELQYINEIYSLMDNDKYEIIDLNDVFCKFVSENKSDIIDSFELLKGSLNQIFKKPDGEESPDFFGLILKEIEKSLSADKVPVLINSGVLYGSGIDNIHIMESEIVMKSALPIIILYPAAKIKDKLMFLNKRSASKYRCMIVE
ncbi:MAG: hypothetical protein HQK79_18600 [Desulfobacterales bacterium]|nr:hypothetical protein [Desulfobacterales bacterium]MBF0397871.1 hypothetical protein [Desulfobacterales bacterium]